MHTRPISHFIMMGDSLSDRGTLDHKHLLGVIPMSKLSGLEGRSPLGRFTNGYVWSDHLGALIAEDFLIKDLEQKGSTEEDIADAIIIHRKKFENLLESSFDLDHDRYINFEHLDFIRNFDEGGLTAHDYSWKPSKSVPRFFSRIILSTLSSMRKKLLEDDLKNKILPDQKEKTLVIEWSGQTI